MTLGPVSSREIHFLAKEIEAQGELLSQERLERIADTDRLGIELETIRATLAKLLPEFAQVYDLVRAENIPPSISPESASQRPAKTPPKIKSG